MCVCLQTFIIHFEIVSVTLFLLFAYLTLLYFVLFLQKGHLHFFPSGIHLPLSLSGQIFHSDRHIVSLWPNMPCCLLSFGTSYFSQNIDTSYITGRFKSFLEKKADDEWSKKWKCTEYMSCKPTYIWCTQRAQGTIVFWTFFFRFIATIWMRLIDIDSIKQINDCIEEIGPKMTFFLPCSSFLPYGGQFVMQKAELEEFQRIWETTKYLSKLKKKSGQQFKEQNFLLTPPWVGQSRHIVSSQTRMVVYFIHSCCFEELDFFITKRHKYCVINP